MIFSTYLPLTASQTPWRQLFPLSLGCGFEAVFCSEASYAGTSAGARAEPCSSGCWYNTLINTTPTSPALQGSLSTEQKKDLQMAVPFLLLYRVFAANATASDPPLHLHGVCSHTQRGSWFGYTDMRKKYSSSIRWALTPLLTQKTKNIPTKINRPEYANYLEFNTSVDVSVIMC